jgi:hypothetical protein
MRDLVKYNASYKVKTAAKLELSEKRYDLLEARVKALEDASVNSNQKILVNEDDVGRLALRQMITSLEGNFFFSFSDVEWKYHGNFTKAAVALQSYPEEGRYGKGNRFSVSMSEKDRKDFIHSFNLAFPGKSETEMIEFVQSLSSYTFKSKQPGNIVAHLENKTDAEIEKFAAKVATPGALWDSLKLASRNLYDEDSGKKMYSDPRED